MINAITLLKRKQGLSVDEFQHYWRHQHADVIATLPGIQRYVQSHPLREFYEGVAPNYERVAELSRFGRFRVKKFVVRSL